MSYKVKRKSAAYNKLSHWCIYNKQQKDDSFGPHLFVCIHCPVVQLKVSTHTHTYSLCNPTHLNFSVILDVQLFRPDVCCLRACVRSHARVQKNKRAHLERPSVMPHSERGFSESVMGIMRNIISYSYRMVNLLKPRWSPHTHSCYRPTMEENLRRTMRDGNLRVCLYMRLTCWFVNKMGVWRLMIMDPSNYKLFAFSCLSVDISNSNPVPVL